MPPRALPENLVVEAAPAKIPRRVNGPLRAQPKAYALFPRERYAPFASRKARRESLELLGAGSRLQRQQACSDRERYGGPHAHAARLHGPPLRPVSAVSGAAFLAARAPASPRNQISNSAPSLAGWTSSSPRVRAVALLAPPLHDAALERSHHHIAAPPPPLTSPRRPPPLHPSSTTSPQPRLPRAVARLLPALPHHRRPGRRPGPHRRRPAGVRLRALHARRHRAHPRR